MFKKTAITNSIVYLFLILLLFAGCSGGVPDGYTYGAHGQLTTIEKANNTTNAFIVFIVLGFLSMVYDNFKKR